MQGTRPLLALVFLLACADAAAQLRIDTSQADAAVALAERFARNDPPLAADLAALQASPGQQRLAARQSSLGASMPDEREWLDYLGSRAPGARALRTTLDAWRMLDTSAAEARALAYLPPGTALRATVYPVVKPSDNSFVYDLRGEPAIFLHLDPSVPPAEFANTVAHELHHVGLAAACPHAKGSDDPRISQLRRWLGGFGEGRAMLAAAGSADVHPHADGRAEARGQWDRDLARAREDIEALAAFFIDLLDGRVSGSDAAALGMRFVNDGSRPQGPFYTVGWLMASTVERAFGRERLVAGSCRPEALLLDYGQALDALGDSEAPRFPAALLQGLRAL